jgi:hypothetical protein
MAFGCFFVQLRIAPERSKGTCSPAHRGKQERRGETDRHRAAVKHGRERRSSNVGSCEPAAMAFQISVEVDPPVFGARLPRGGGGGWFRVTCSCRLAENTCWAWNHRTARGEQYVDGWCRRCVLLENRSCQQAAQAKQQREMLRLHIPSPSG